MRSRCSAVLAAVVVALTGCSTGNTDEAVAALGTGSSSCVPATVSTRWAGVVTLCLTLTEVRVTNVSPLVLVVSAPLPAIVSVARPAGASTSLTAAASEQVLSSAALPGDGERLPPAATATVLLTRGPQEVFLRVDDRVSVQHYAADLGARYAEKRLMRPDRRLATSSVECGREVVDLWSAQGGTGGSTRSLEEIMIGYVQTGRACRSLIQEARDAARPAPPPASAADEFRAAAKGIWSGLADDLLKFGKQAARAAA